MNREVAFEITHIVDYLQASFSGKLAVAVSGTPEQRNANFLSRALAAYTIHKLSNCSFDAAADAVVDGGNDGGIDAIHYDATTNTLWVVQSKFFQTGRGEPDLGSVMKFKAGLEYLLEGEFSAFQANTAWQTLIPRLPGIFADDALQVRAVLVYSGVTLVSEDRCRLFEALQVRFSERDEYLNIQFCNLTTVHDWITGADQDLGVDRIELNLLNPGEITEPYKTIYGMISLVELAKIYDTHGKKLIAANIRAYKGTTAVNEQIITTIREEPAHFFYLNNGLTAYCKRLQVHNNHRGNSKHKLITAYGLSIVNGAQTLGSIATYFANPVNSETIGFVSIKVISLQNCEDDRGFVRRLARSTNFQNQIGARNYVALDEQQERIRTHLEASGIFYHYKDDTDTPEADDTNFTLDEATTACASLANRPDCDFCARILADRQSLWSFEPLSNGAEPYRSRYSQIFRADMSARTVWRAVQARRVVITALKSSESGVRKDFFVNCRWLVLSIIFVRLHPQQGEGLSLVPDEIARITAEAQAYAEKLWQACQSNGFVSERQGGGWEAPHHFRSVFSKSGDCQLLYRTVLEQLATSNLRDQI